MNKRVLNSPKVAEAVGPWSQGVRVGNLVFVSGQTPQDRDGNLIGKGDISVQTTQVLENLRAVLEAGGGGLQDIVDMTVFLTDMRHVGQVLEVRKQYLEPPFPASTAVEVNHLANEDWLIEIKAVAIVQ